MKKINQLLTAFSIIVLFSTIQSYAQVNQPIKLKFLTYNVGHFNQGKLGGFQGDQYTSQQQLQKWREWIGQQGADFMIVNEWNQYFDKDGKYHAKNELLDPYYSYVHLGTQNEWIYNGIATNHKLDNIREVQWFGQYYALIGDLEIGDKKITIIATHIPWQEQWHDQSIELLKKELSKYPYFICLGDFNAKNKTFEELIKLNYNVASGGPMGWFYSAPGGKMAGKVDINIDNIITSPNIKIMKVEAPHTGLNDLDHLPVLAEITIAQ